MGFDMVMPLIANDDVHVYTFGFCTNCYIRDSLSEILIPQRMRMGTTVDYVKGQDDHVVEGRFERA